MKKNIEVSRLKEIICYLESNPKIDHQNICYDEMIFELLNSLGIDKKYIERYERIEETDISNLTLRNLKTIYTYILRGERFSYGFILSNIEDGTLLKLAKRELELLE